MFVRRTRTGSLRLPAPLIALLAAGAVTGAGACTSGDSAPARDDVGILPDATVAGDADAGSPPAPPADASVDADAPATTARVLATTGSTRVYVQPLMFASGEMQISGEPFAESFLGRNLDGYDRHRLPTDLYSPSSKFLGDEIVDLLGYSTAVESYEYTKFHLIMLALQVYAGPSLAWGPIVNAAGSEDTQEEVVRARLYGRVRRLIQASCADLAGFAVIPPPKDNPLNRLGFSGLHPIVAPYRSFDPTMNPDSLLARGCSFNAGYGSGTGVNEVPDYECGYASLALADRLGQIELVVSPGAIGMTTWKGALWAIDFSGRLHDAKSFFVARVKPSDEQQVGKAGNKVVGEDAAGKPTAPGTYLGSTPLEGMWGLLLVDEADNAAQWLLSSLSTSDGKTLGGFASRLEATKYDYSSPVRWWPAAVSMGEGPPSEWPRPRGLAIASAVSRAEDLSALLLGHALTFGMTDARNEGVGKKLGLRLTFAGDPFPADDGLPDGEATLHDRTLAVIRVAFVNLDRLHTFPKTSALVDEATPGEGGAIARGNRASTTSLAHATIALRQTLLALNGAITQYGGADPSPKADEKGILNAIPIKLADGTTPTFSARVRSVLVAQSDFVRDVLTTADGMVANGATFSADGKPTRDDTPATIESQTAAIRALLEGFLTTGDRSFVERARVVARRLEADFWIADGKSYRGVSKGEDAITMSPERFGFLQSALREMHKIGPVAGDRVLSRTVLEARITRVNKLYLNGWDDVNGNRIVDKPTECLGGRLQLGEQALTGEWGKDSKGALAEDRDGDCVLHIPFARVGSLLAGDVKFRVTR